MRLLFLLLLITPGVCAQEPLELAQTIFGRDSFPELARHSTGEYRGRPNGRDLSRGTTLQFLLLQQNDAKAVVAMNVRDSSGRSIDTYLHFRKDSIWKLAAFRSLAMTGLVAQAKEQLEQLTPAQVDSLVAQGNRSGNKKEALIRSYEDYVFLLGNTRLILESDENLIRYFRNHQAAFEELRSAAQKEAAQRPPSERTRQLLATRKADYRKLLLSSVSIGSLDFGEKCVDFSIGGMVDNTVGFLYVTDPRYLPEINPARIIMIREIGGGWYLYKTT